MPRISLVGPEIEENLSLRYLASSLAAAGYESDILAFNGASDFQSVLRAILDADERPILVGLSLAFQWRANDFLALAMALREGGYTGHITAGGHFGTFACREILSDFPEFDTVVRQEAEETLVSLVRAVETGGELAGIAGLAYRTADGEVRLTCLPGVPDLTTLPRPDRRGEPARVFGHGIAPLVSTRGCYANCSFCCIAAWHEETLPGKRYRIREPDDVADEMLAMQRERGIDIFVFHDDNFFLPGHARNRARFTALADALDARGMGPFATVVKARPTDVDPAVFRVLVDRLQCIRVYVGIESDADQGLDTLNRWAQSRHNHRAIHTARELNLYTCFNLLIFDPDTTLDSLRTNVAFMESAAEFAFNFGRVELYAGTPLLSRMLKEDRCTGDWLQWDYRMSSPEVQRAFELTMAAFGPRNFGDAALHNDLMGTRFDVEVARHFHRESFRPGWMTEGHAISRAMAADTVAGMRRVLAHVENGGSDDAAFLTEVSGDLRRAEVEIRARAIALAGEITDALGRGRSLTEVGDRVATPLQQARALA